MTQDLDRLILHVQIDDCRRTHNYDAFVTTFLTMLAEQGHLADLVNDNLMIQRKTSNTPARTKHTSPSSNSVARSITKTTTPPPPARRRAKAKRRRWNLLCMAMWCSAGWCSCCFAALSIIISCLGVECLYSSQTCGRYSHSQMCSLCESRLAVVRSHLTHSDVKDSLAGTFPCAMEGNLVKRDCVRFL